MEVGGSTSSPSAFRTAFSFRASSRSSAEQLVVLFRPRVALLLQHVGMLETDQIGGGGGSRSSFGTSSSSSATARRPLWGGGGGGVGTARSRPASPRRRPRARAARRPLSARRRPPSARRRPRARVAAVSSARRSLQHLAVLEPDSCRPPSARRRPFSPPFVLLEPEQLAVLLQHVVVLEPSSSPSSFSASVLLQHVAFLEPSSRRPPSAARRRPSARARRRPQQARRRPEREHLLNRPCWLRSEPENVSSRRRISQVNRNWVG